MSNKIILASKSKVRKDILDNYKILNKVKPSNVDEDIIKDALIKEKASPEIISKNLAELKANKVSSNQPGQLVLGADSVIFENKFLSIAIIFIVCASISSILSNNFVCSDLADNPKSFLSFLARV